MAQGILPLWNPYCNLGAPVVHDGTSSMFYPGKLIFWLRFLSFPARYGIYIAIHVPIAAAGAYWFARTLRASKPAATLASFSFAFGGPVLFQVTNAPFLISASWLPFALCSVWLMFRQLKFKWAIWTAVFCSMMILAGDPQMCYHVGLIMSTFVFWKYLRARRRDRKSQLRQQRSPWITLLHASTLVATTIIITSLLSAIQVLPSYVWSQQSIRAQSHAHLPTPNFVHHSNEPGIKLMVSELQSITGIAVPRNVYQLARHGGDAWEGILGEPDASEHTHHAYQFSQPPWTLAELVWPNFSGKPYPIHKRWVDGLPAAERMWTPSIYMGSFVLLLALLGLNPFSTNRKRAWLARLILFFWHRIIRLVRACLVFKRSLPESFC